MHARHDVVDVWTTKVAEEARRVHGISAERTRNAAPLSGILRDFAAWVCGLARDVAVVMLVAHNALNFDLQVLFWELSRTGMQPGDLAPLDAHLLFGDSKFAWRVAWPTWSRHADAVVEERYDPDGLDERVDRSVHTCARRPSLALSALHVHVLGYEFSGAHGALSDAQALERVVYGYGGRDVAPLAAIIRRARTLHAAIECFDAAYERIRFRPQFFEPVPLPLIDLSGLPLALELALEPLRAQQRRDTDQADARQLERETERRPPKRAKHFYEHASVERVDNGVK